MTTFFQTENVGSLEQRALTPAGIDLLEYIAERERKLKYTFLNNTSRRLKRRTNQSENELLALRHAGFVSDHRFESNGPSNNVGFAQRVYYKLTEAGWKVVGNKPIWLE
jgi:hypothetical protein